MIRPLHIVAADNRLALYITGYIGEEVTDLDVIATLQANKTAKELVVYINSGGGDVTTGNSIARAIEMHPAKTKTAHVVGTCASMATIVALSCDKIIMDALGQWMVHYPWSMVLGRSEDFAQTAIVQKDFEQWFLGLYCKRTGQTPEAMDELLKQEKWLTAAQALEMGFVDEVQTLAMAAFTPPATTPKTLTTTPQNQPEMKINKMLGLAEAAAPEAAETAVQQLLDKVATLEKHVAEASAVLEKHAQEQAAKVQAMVEKVKAHDADAADAVSALAEKDFAKAEAYAHKVLAAAAAPAPTTGAPIVRLTSTFAANPNADERKGWDFDTWGKNDPEGLLAMRTAHPQAYSDLIKNRRK